MLFIWGFKNVNASWLLKEANIRQFSWVWGVPPSWGNLPAEGVPFFPGNWIMLRGLLPGGLYLPGGEYFARGVSLLGNFTWGVYCHHDGDPREQNDKRCLLPCPKLRRAVQWLLQETNITQFSWFFSPILQKFINTAQFSRLQELFQTMILSQYASYNMHNTVQEINALVKKAEILEIANF